MPQSYLTSIEMQAGDQTQSLVLELAASILSTEPYFQLYTVTPAISPAPEEYASHLPAVTMGLAPLGPHSTPVKVRISQILRGKGTVFVRGEIPCDSKHSPVDHCTH